MGLNVLGYQSHLLQRYHPVCGHEESSHLSPVLAVRFLMAILLIVQYSYKFDDVLFCFRCFFFCICSRL